MERPHVDGLDHLLGCSGEELSFLPRLGGSIEKEARRRWSEREKLALIEEEGAASNVHKIDVAGTHYETQSAADIARLILPLKGI